MLNSGIFCAFCDSKIFESDRTCPNCGAPTKCAVVIKTEDKHADVDSAGLVGDYSFSFISGTEQILNFNVFDNESGDIIQDGKLIWSLISYRDNTGVLLKNTAIKNGKATINLNKNDTHNLNGKFIQNVFVESNDIVFHMAQGIISIIKRIQ
jgi:hypothetical protein